MKRQGVPPRHMTLDHNLDSLVVNTTEFFSTIDRDRLDGAAMIPAVDVVSPVFEQTYSSVVPSIVFVEGNATVSGLHPNVVIMAFGSRIFATLAALVVPKASSNKDDICRVIFSVSRFLCPLCLKLVGLIIKSSREWKLI
mmetsp:Transcript_5655/g.11081  ORF Transcript_5655/g.11081 Transcript_5655/m.11081 type:complete len:140 (-) Transcript_5655:161-580(-)